MGKEYEYKYQHIERIGTEETDGILDGKVHVFYKIDGTNGVVWYNNDIICASRNNVLLDTDNAGFKAYINRDNRYKLFFIYNPNLILYGEWLVKHSVEYEKEAYRKFYIFDVIDKYTNEYLSYEEYLPLICRWELDYIPVIDVLENPKMSDLEILLKKANAFLVPGGLNGEGIVIKNYDYKNKYDRRTWAKILTKDFCAKKDKKPTIFNDNENETRIVYEMLTVEFLEKEKLKIVEKYGEWKSNYIGEFIGRAQHEFIKDYIFEILKKYKNPTINFNVLIKLLNEEARKYILNCKSY